MSVCSLFAIHVRVVPNRYCWTNNFTCKGTHVLCGCIQYMDIISSIEDTHWSVYYELRRQSTMPWKFNSHAYDGYSTSMTNSFCIFYFLWDPPHGKL